MSIKEGKAEILFPSENEVFYNPVQEFNRDLTIAIINEFGKLYLQELKEKRNKKPKKESTKGDGLCAIKEKSGITVFEGLSATGLRSVRFAKEIQNLEKVVANDFDPVAVELIKRNIEHNQVGYIVEATQGDANFVMFKAMNEQMPFDVIDIDPYGSATPFIDLGVRSIADGGLLCVTCTDMAVLAGGQTETCYAKYGGTYPPNASFVHEMGLRMLLNLIQSSAAKYDRIIEPLASLSIDFYVRVFVRIRVSAIGRKQTAGKSSVIYYCHSCRSFQTQVMGKITLVGNGAKYGTMPLAPSSNLCTECTAKLHIAGPFYSGTLHNKNFLIILIDHIKNNPEKYGTQERMIGMLAVASEELESLLYYHIPSLCHRARCETPPLKLFTSALLNQGYQVSTSHAYPASIKTNASSEAIWDVIRSWIKINPIKNLKEDEIAYKLLQKEIKINADFTLHPSAESDSKKVKLVRYQMNPLPNWGPKGRATSKRDRKEIASPDKKTKK